MRRVWLASYPKSGNTWFRMLVANLSATDNCPVDINDLPERGGIASARAPFDHLLLIDSGLLTHDEIDLLRPRVHEAHASDVEDDDERGEDATTKFMKTHDGYTLTSAGEPLLAGARGADGAVVIVRDPRDVAPSLANHMHTPIDRAIDFMNDERAGFAARPTSQNVQLRQTLSTWSHHVAGWLDQVDLPVQLVRYEDLQVDTAGMLRRVLDFAGRSAADEQIQRAVAFADFRGLQQQERDRGFREAPRPQAGGNFFRRGETGAWRDELTAEQVARIESAHAPMMRRLGYVLSTELAHAGERRTS